MVEHAGVSMLRFDRFMEGDDGQVTNGELELLDGLFRSFIRLVYDEEKDCFELEALAF